MLKALRIAAVLLVLGIGLYGCDNDTSTEMPEGNQPVSELTCIGCHSSEDDLRANVSSKSVDLVVAVKGDG